MSGTTTGWIDYDYAVLRVVPHVHLGVFTPAGVVLHARTARYLGFHAHVDAARLAALSPELDAARLERFLDAYRRIAEGGVAAGPIGVLPPSERFHWLTAPRSAVLQASSVRAGRTRDPQGELARLCGLYLADAPSPGGG